MNDRPERWSRRAFCTAAGAMAVPGALAAPFDRSRIAGAPVSISRGFTRIGDRQLHYRLGEPATAAALTARPVVCFHQTPNASQVFIEFIAALATDRRVFAVDTPGLGESDLPPGPPEIDDYAAAMREFLAVQQLDDVDVVGYHTGASIAVSLANLVPRRVRHLLLVGLALFDEAERAQFFEQPWPRPREADGEHLVTEWRRSFRWRGPGQSDDSVERTFIEKISAGQTAWWGARAVMRHDLAAALARVEQPMLVVSAKDDLADITPRIRALRPDVELVEIDDAGFGVFEIMPARMAAMARRHFDGAPAS